jgi:hypothetical protein
MTNPTDLLFHNFLARLRSSVRTNQWKNAEAIREHFFDRSYYIEKGAGGIYVFKVASGEFRVFNEQAFIREMVHRGLHTEPIEKKSKRKNICDLGEEKLTKEEIKARAKAHVSALLSRIREFRNYDFVGVLAGYQPDAYDINGYRFVVTHKAHLPEPRKGDCGFYEQLVASLTGDPVHGEIQYHTIKTYCKLGLNSWLGGPPFIPMQALLLAGGVHYGKTLFAEEVLGRMFGGFSDATVYFASESRPFNDEIARAGVSILDDQNFPARMNRQSFFDRIRKCAATTTRRVEAKFGNSINVPVQQMMVLLCNTEDHNVDWFPDITGDLADKIHMIKCAKAELPSGPGHREKIRGLLDAQLPAWLCHLKFEYQPPAEILNEGRHGMEAWQHPDLKAQNYAARERADFIVVLNQVLDGRQDQEIGKGPALVFMQAFLQDRPDIVEWTKQHIRDSARMGRLLSDVQSEMPNQLFVFEDRHAHRNQYRAISRKKAGEIEKSAEETKTRIIEAKIPKAEAIK